MGWASQAIISLQAGDLVTIFPRGNSMEGKVESGQRVVVAPYGDEPIAVGDIVLCRVKSREYLHLVLAVSKNRFQIGNNKGHINGWIGKNSIFGKAVEIG